MKIVDKISAKKSMYDNPPVTIACIGDSITQGCFEVFHISENELDTVFEYKNAYSTHLRQMLAYLYPNVQVNVINSGISGDCAKDGIKRLQRDVLKYSPDLVIIGYGANESVGYGKEGIKEYGEVLRSMFKQIKDIGSEVIYLTEGPLCTKESPHLASDFIRSLARKLMYVENNGIIAEYFEEGKRVAKEEGVKVCDVYSSWKMLEKSGVDITELLSNKLNHPSREFQKYMALKLVEKIFED